MNEQARKTDTTLVQEKTRYGAIEYRTHATDYAIHLRAHTAEDLFRLAAWALARIQVPEWSGDAGEEERLELLSDDWDDLLVNWINGLIALSERRRVVWIEADFERLASGELRARVRGPAWPDDASQMGRDVKSASYHGLEVVPGPVVWHARVALDL